jgi:hypothetical protein
MPLLTRAPQNGGLGTTLSGATSDLPRTTGSAASASQRLAANRPGAAVAGLALGLLLPVGRQLLGRHLSALHRHERVHEAQPLECVPRVADVAVEDLAEALLDVRPGERRAAEDDRELRGDPAGVHLQQVLLHDHCRLDEQARHPDDVHGVLLRRVKDRRDGLLDPEVDDAVAVVGQDHVHEVADVVDVTLHRGQDDPALAVLALDPVHVRLEMGHRGLHDLRALQHEGQLHLPRAEQLADELHPLEQRLVDDLERLATFDRRLYEIGLQAGLLAVDDPRRRRSSSGSCISASDGASCGRRRTRRCGGC